MTVLCFDDDALARDVADRLEEHDCNSNSRTYAGGELSTNLPSDRAIRFFLNELSDAGSIVVTSDYVPELPSVDVHRFTADADTANIDTADAVMDELSSQGVIDPVDRGSDDDKPDVQDRLDGLGYL